MHPIFKLPSKHSSSSSGSLKILNLNDVDHLKDSREDRKDLFDMLLDEEPQMSPTSLPNHSPCTVLEHTEEVLRTIEHMNLSPRQQPNNNQQGCKCTKIDCLKLYCECFAKGKQCNSNCVCTCCKNHGENIEEIYHAKQLVNFKHPNYFHGIPAIVPTRKCTCKKSQCRKKYCECFNAGLKCTEECECCDCHNDKPSYNEHYYKGGRMEIEVQA